MGSEDQAGRSLAEEAALEGQALHNLAEDRGHLAEDQEHHSPEEGLAEGRDRHNLEVLGSQLGQGILEDHPAEEDPEDQDRNLEERESRKDSGNPSEGLGLEEYQVEEHPWGLAGRIPAGEDPEGRDSLGVAAPAAEDQAGRSHAAGDLAGSLEEGPAEGSPVAAAAEEGAGHNRADLEAARSQAEDQAGQFAYIPVVQGKHPTK